MPKKLKVNPNERIDLDDFNRASIEYTTESDKFNRSKLLQSRRSLVSHGFRVELSNQTTHPGQFTVYNGVAIDRDGTLLNNEQQVNDARVVTLLGTNTDFYIEIEFAETDSDVDSRAFWDSTYTGNTPPGKEFSLNVATRTTPDWKVVYPVDTTGYEVDTDPNSTKIPIAYLRTDVDNEIDNASVWQAVTVLEEDAVAGATSLQVVDSSLFPDTGTLWVPPEFGVILSANDRVNNILTIGGGGLGADTLAGNRVERTDGVDTIITESTLPTPTAATAEDVRRRLYAGDEIRGSALSSSKYSVDKRDDLQLRSVKDHVDFLAAQIREMKFGSLRSDENNELPPVSFSIGTRYFDAAGSITGARSNSVTVGNGLHSWGDVNNSNLATAIELAHDTGLVGGGPGGSIYVKRGTYVWDKSITFDRPVHLIFEKGVFFTTGTYAGGLTLSNGHAYIIEGLPDMSAQHAFGLDVADTTGNDITLNSCFFDIVLFDALAVGVNFSATNCTFKNSVSTVSGTIVGATPASFIDKIDFNNCTISYQSTSDNTVSLVTNILNKMTFRNCKFDLSESTGSCRGFVKASASSAVSDLIFDNCVFTNTDTTGGAYHGIDLTAGTIDDVTIRDCTFEFDWFISLGTPPTCILLDATTRLRRAKVTGCNFNDICNDGFPGSTNSNFGSVVTFDAAAGSTNNGNVIENNFFGRNASTLPVDFAYFIKAITTSTGHLGISIRGNKFSQFNTAIYVEDKVNAVIDSNEFLWYYIGAVYNETLTAIEVTGSDGKVTISNNNIDMVANCSSPTVDAYGISGNQTSSKLIISSNNISINSYTRDTTYGIELLNTLANLDAVITNNSIFVTAGSSNVYGIRFAGGSTYSSNTTTSSNNIDIVPSVNAALNNYCIQLSSDLDTANLDIRNTISNNVLTIKGSIVTSSVRARAISASGQNTSVSGNVTHTWYGLLSYGVHLRGVNMSAVGNHVTQHFDATQTPASGDAVYGIMVQNSSADPLTNVNVSNNVVAGGKSTAYSIYVENNSTGTSAGITINGNNLTTKSEVPTVNSGCISIQNDSTGTLSGVTVGSNTCIEEYTSVYNIRKMIFAEASAGTIEGIVVSSNNIRGAIDGASSDRQSATNSAAIFVTQCDRVMLSGNNVVNWSTLTESACSILVQNGDAVSVWSNACSPSTNSIPAIFANINTDVVVANNTAWGSNSTATFSGTHTEHWVAPSSGVAATTESNHI